MKTSRLLTVALAMVIPAAACLANLNETPAQFESRYGKEIKSEPGPKPGIVVRDYVKKDINVHVVFIGERAQHVRYERPSGNLTLEEVRQILDANKDITGDWKKIDMTDKPGPRLLGVGVHWVRNDKAEAYVCHAKRGEKGHKEFAAKYVVLATDQWLSSSENRF